VTDTTEKGKRIRPFALKPTDLINYPQDSRYPPPARVDLINPLKKVVSDGTTASYYELPPEAKELQDIISYKNMNSQIGEIFRACMRYGEVEHSSKLRDINKILFYAREEKRRLERYENE